MRTDILKSIERTIENGLEDNGIKSVEIKSNVIKVEMENGRAFARLFPQQEERVARKVSEYMVVVEGICDNLIFYMDLTKTEYNEFVNHFPVTETWESEEVEENESN